MKFLENHKKIFISSIVVISLILIIISAGEKYQPTLVNNILGFLITPVQGVFTNASQWVSGKVDFIVRLGEIENENKALKEQIDILKAENSRLRSLDEENHRLSELFELRERYTNYPMVGANVIANDAGNWYDTFIIDKGTRDGLKKDMSVLASGGLAGRIVETGYNYSKVKPIINLTSSTAVIPAKSPRTDETGYMHGDLYQMMENKCVMDLISEESEIMPGDEIVTSPLSTICPPGIIIGNVLEVRNNFNNTKQAIIEPYVDFRRIETVLVITQLFDKELIDSLDYQMEENEGNESK